MLEKVSELDLFTIAEQAVSKSECSGVAVFTLNEQGEPANLIFLMNNGETVDVTDFELSFKRFDRRNQGTQKVEQFSVNGSNLLSDVEGVAKVLLLEDFSAVGGLVFLLDKQGGSATQAELAMELAVERLKLALERTHTYKCPVISTNTQLNQKLELLNEIGSISKTGGWEVDLASGVITWTDEMFRIYGLPHGSPVSISTAMAYFPPETKKAITASFDKVVREGKEYCHEGFLRRADGKVLRIKATGKPRYTGKRLHRYLVHWRTSQNSTGYWKPNTIMRPT